jgi:hypothetical protein
MATTKKAAKKAVPKVEEPKQIIMTTEQYDSLVSIKEALDTATDTLKRLGTDEETNIKAVGFILGQVHTDLLAAYFKVNDLKTELDPDPIFYDSEEDDSNNDENNW